MAAQVGNFRIIKLIGKGFDSECFIGVHNETRERVCIKQIKKANKNIQRILREIDILKRIDHPNIVKFIDSFETEAHIFVIQEFCNGCELIKMINGNNVLSKKSIKKIFCQLIQAVEYLHKNEISHGDIKPENVLCDDMFNIKLIDFGFANQTNKKLTFFGGSLEYTSPEILSGIPYFGDKADMWSCGICLYVLLFMKFPFDDKTEQEVKKKIKDGKFSYSQPISHEADAIIRNLLIVDPFARMTATQVLKRLESSQLEEKNINVCFDILDEIEDSY